MDSKMQISEVINMWEELQGIGVKENGKSICCPAGLEAIKITIEELKKVMLRNRCGGCKYEDNTSRELPCPNCMRGLERDDLYEKISEDSANRRAYERIQAYFELGLITPIQRAEYLELLMGN